MQSSIGVLAGWLQALLSASRTLDFPGRETRGSGHYLRMGFLLSLQWLGVPWRGSGEGRASQVLHGLETWPWVCVCVCGSGGDGGGGEGATPKEGSRESPLVCSRWQTPLMKTGLLSPWPLAASQS